MRRNSTSTNCLFLFFVAHALARAASPLLAVPDTPFVQEYRDEVAYPRIDKADQLRAIAVSEDNTVWIATKAGVFHRQSDGWIQAFKGSAYALAVRPGEVWAGTWQGLYRVESGTAEKIDAIATVPIVALCADATGVVAATQSALYEWDGGRWISSPWTGPKSIRSIARDSEGGLWIATGMGAYYKKGGALREIYKEADLLTGELRSVAITPAGDVWLGGLGGLDIYRKGRRAESHNTTNGMPNQDVRCLVAEPDGTVWAGTALGAVRRIGGRWSLRYSRRWLPSDDVRGIAVGHDHTVWVATSAGLSAIRRKQMTLADKADHYLQTCLARHVRAPYLVEQCDLKAPGDTEHFTPRDDDNEGGYTGAYLVMESFRYAVTKDPRALENARKAFGAMKFLQEVTGTSGFFARTVVPSDWTRIHDGNETIPPEERADRIVQNPRDKPLENRWRRSADGKWLWKGDTSSDETSMHFFAYLTYYRLAADEAERQVVREHVRRIADHMIAGGYTFRDIDGKPTLWAVWSPEKLNGDADWRAERWLNGLEILGYLRLAELVTGDAKYHRAALALIDKDHYDVLARRPLATEPSERTHFDQELAGAALSLALTEDDPRLRKIYEEGLAFWWQRVRSQNSPWFNFIWASLANPADPTAFHLNECVDALRDEPLDLVQWTVDSRKREDVRLVHEPVLDDVQVDRILPPSERATIRSDSNLYSAVRGEDGMSESSGVFWLLPYWMGRYYGFIDGPKSITAIAHRGEHLSHIENTLPAFQAAIDAGADYFECDVRTTADGRLVLMHDGTVNRTTNGKGRVSDLTFDQIRALGVPTFEEALNLAKGRIGIYVDNKQTSPAALVEAIERAGMGDRVVIYGGSELRQIHALRPAWKVMPEADSVSHLGRVIDDLHLKVAAFDRNDFNPETIAVAGKAGIDIFVDRLGPQDNEPGWQSAIDAGATGIQTDHPAELVRYLRARRLHR